MRAYAAPDTQALRGWQRRALVRYLAAQPRDFLTVATPGSGKTAFALRVAGELLADGSVEQITVVVPTEHLKTQWALAAARRRHRARPEVQQFVGADVVGVPRRRRHLRPSGQPPDPAPGAHREPPHARRVRRDPPRRRREELGRGDPRGVRRCDATPRSHRHPVPQRRRRDPVRHLRARRPTGLMRSQADHTYGYAEALADGVVRPVVFLAYSGEPLAQQRRRGTRGARAIAGLSAHAWQARPDALPSCPGARGRTAGTECARADIAALPTSRRTA